ncbi:hypothetical protein C8R45DRAFT_926852 [Mycena sanguinolenta]|nr:hypothetical protein C8R45DRAFT_926852 [Mycena sanguinolenta]
MSWHSRRKGRKGRANGNSSCELERTVSLIFPANLAFHHPYLGVLAVSSAPYTTLSRKAVEHWLPSQCHPRACCSCPGFPVLRSTCYFPYVEVWKCVPAAEIADRSVRLPDFIAGIPVILDVATFSDPPNQCKVIVFALTLTVPSLHVYFDPPHYNVSTKLDSNQRRPEAANSLVSIIETPVKSPDAVRRVFSPKKAAKSTLQFASAVTASWNPAAGTFPCKYTSSFRGILRPTGFGPARGFGNIEAVGEKGQYWVNTTSHLRSQPLGIHWCTPLAAMQGRVVTDIWVHLTMELGSNPACLSDYVDLSPKRFLLSFLDTLAHLLLQVAIGVATEMKVETRQCKKKLVRTDMITLCDVREVTDVLYVADDFIEKIPPHQELDSTDSQ